MAIDAAAVTAYADALAVIRGGVTGSLKEIDFAEATRDMILTADVATTVTGTLPDGPPAATGTGGLT